MSENVMSGFEKDAGSFAPSYANQIALHINQKKIWNDEFALDAKDIVAINNVLNELNESPNQELINLIASNLANNLDGSARGVLREWCGTCPSISETTFAKLRNSGVNIPVTHSFSERVYTTLTGYSEQIRSFIQPRIDAGVRINSNDIEEINKIFERLKAKPDNRLIKALLDSVSSKDIEQDPKPLQALIENNSEVLNVDLFAEVIKYIPDFSLVGGFQKEFWTWKSYKSQFSRCVAERVQKLGTLELSDIENVNKELRELEISPTTELVDCLMNKLDTSTVDANSKNVIKELIDNCDSPISAETFAKIFGLYPVPLLQGCGGTTINCNDVLLSRLTLIPSLKISNSDLNGIVDLFKNNLLMPQLILALSDRLDDSINKIDFYKRLLSTLNVSPWFFDNQEIDNYYRSLVTILSKIDLLVKTQDQDNYNDLLEKSLSLVMHFNFPVKNCVENLVSQYLCSNSGYELGQDFGQEQLNTILGLLRNQKNVTRNVVEFTLSKLSDDELKISFINGLLSDVHNKKIPFVPDVVKYVSSLNCDFDRFALFSVMNENEAMGTPQSLLDFIDKHGSKIHFDSFSDFVDFLLSSVSAKLIGNENAWRALWNEPYARQAALHGYNCYSMKKKFKEAKEKKDKTEEELRVMGEEIDKELDKVIYWHTENISDITKSMESLRNLYDKVIKHCIPNPQDRTKILNFVFDKMCDGKLFDEIFESFSSLLLKDGSEQEEVDSDSEQKRAEREAKQTRVKEIKPWFHKIMHSFSDLIAVHLEKNPDSVIQIIDGLVAEGGFFALIEKMTEEDRPDFFDIFCSVIDIFKSLSELIMPDEDGSYNSFLQTLFGNHVLFLALYDLYTPDNWKPYRNFYAHVFEKLSIVLSSVAETKGKTELLKVFDDWGIGAQLCNELIYKEKSKNSFAENYHDWIRVYDNFTHRIAENGNYKGFLRTCLESTKDTETLNWIWDFFVGIYVKDKDEAEKVRNTFEGVFASVWPHIVEMMRNYVTGSNSQEPIRELMNDEVIRSCITGNDPPVTFTDLYCRLSRLFIGENVKGTNAQVYRSLLRVVCSSLYNKVTLSRVFDLFSPYNIEKIKHSTLRNLISSDDVSALLYKSLVTLLDTDLSPDPILSLLNSNLFKSISNIISKYRTSKEAEGQNESDIGNIFGILADILSDDKYSDFRCSCDKLLQTGWKKLVGNSYDNSILKSFGLSKRLYKFLSKELKTDNLILTLLRCVKGIKSDYTCTQIYSCFVLFNNVCTRNKFIKTLTVVAELILSPIIALVALVLWGKKVFSVTFNTKIKHEFSFDAFFSWLKECTNYLANLGDEHVHFKNEKLRKVVNACINFFIRVAQIIVIPFTFVCAGIAGLAKLVSFASDSIRHPGQIPATNAQNQEKQLSIDKKKEDLPKKTTQPENNEISEGEDEKKESDVSSKKPNETLTKIGPRPLLIPLPQNYKQQGEF